jgi:hypothetical protein
MLYIQVMMFRVSVTTQTYIFLNGTPSIFLRLTTFFSLFTS